MPKQSLNTWIGAVSVYAAVQTAVRRWRESRYSLSGRVVLITGGSRGLGLLLAREYARRGARLALVARSASTAPATSCASEVPRWSRSPAT